MKDLLRQFRAGEVLHDELIDLIGQHFKGAVATSRDTVVYPNEGAAALTVTYRGNAISTITPGPAITDADIEAIAKRVEEDLLGPRKQAVTTLTAFCQLPVIGWYRYGDVFQILRAPSHFPRPPQVLGEHPFLLQVRFDDSPNFSIRLRRSLTAAREAALALGVILDGSIVLPDSAGRYHWSVMPNDDLTKINSAYLQEGYIVQPGFEGSKDDFADPAGYDPLELVNPQTYYGRLGRRLDQTLDLPDNIDDLLNRFSRLAEKERAQFLRACYWLRHGSIVHSYSRSAAFTALISAIEAILPDAETGKACETCGRMIAKGPTQRFAEFVDKFAPKDPDSDNNRKKLYSVRSDLSHGWSLLHTDERSWGPGLTPSYLKEWETTSGVVNLAQVVLVNWLLAK